MHIGLCNDDDNDEDEGGNDPLIRVRHRCCSRSSPSRPRALTARTLTARALTARALSVRAHTLVGSVQSLDWNGGPEWWNGMVES